MSLRHLHRWRLGWQWGSLLQPTRLRRQAKLGPRFFCFPCFASWLGVIIWSMCSKMKKNLSNLVKRQCLMDSKKRWIGGLAKKANDISHHDICVPLLQCKPSAVVSSAYGPTAAHLCANLKIMSYSLVCNIFNFIIYWIYLAMSKQVGKYKGCCLSL